MLASVSCVLREAMAAHLNAIVGRMIESLVSDEGLTVSVASYPASYPAVLALSLEITVSVVYHLTKSSITTCWLYREESCYWHAQ